jgi:hypothetical protein
VLLRITFVSVLFWKVLSSKAWNCANLLLFQRSCVTTGSVIVNFLELSHGLLRCLLSCLTMEISWGSIE